MNRIDSSTLALLLSLTTVLCGYSTAAAQQPDTSDERRSASIVEAADRTCREGVVESLQEPEPQRDQVKADFLQKLFDPDALCGCTTRHLDMALESGRVDPKDRPAVAGLFERTFNECLIDGVIDNYRGFCNAIFTSHYGQEALTGPYGPEISRFCDCGVAGLHQLRPDQLASQMQPSADALGSYRDTGILEDKHDGSLVSIMAGCGLVDLKRKLIESMNR